LIFESLASYISKNVGIIEKNLAPPVAGSEKVTTFAAANPKKPRCPNCDKRHGSADKAMPKHGVLCKSGRAPENFTDSFAKFLQIFLTIQKIVRTFALLFALKFWERWKNAVL
jgi:hypothetical protein